MTEEFNNHTEPEESNSNELHSNLISSGSFNLSEKIPDLDGQWIRTKYVKEFIKRLKIDLSYLPQYEFRVICKKIDKRAGDKLT